MNEGRWIIVHEAARGKRYALNLDHIIAVRECSSVDIHNGKRAIIDFSDGTTLTVSEDFEQIGAMIK